jgi:FkbM family methyltransferase
MLRTLVRILREEGAGGIWIRLKVAVAKQLHPSIVTSRYGVRLKGNWRDLTFQFYHQGAYGYYLSSLLSGLREEFVFLDIGANQGLYSILASKNRMCARVHAFEPVRETAALLRENLHLNGCNNVSVNESAISSRSGTYPIATNPEHSGSTSLRAETTAEESGHLKQIECVSHLELERLEAQVGCRIFAKIDVEGYEETVIRELIACPFFPRMRDVFYEVDERWVDPGRLTSILRSRGFNTFDKIGDGQHYDVHARRQGLQPLSPPRGVPQA